MARKNISGNSPREPIFGYSRAVRVGNLVFVAGTTATADDGTIVGPGDPYAQAVQTFKNIRRALEQAGATFEDVVRSRVFVTDIGYRDAIARAHAEIFGQIRPAATLVAIDALASPEMLVEIEVDAVLE